MKISFPQTAVLALSFFSATAFTAAPGKYEMLPDERALSQSRNVKPMEKLPDQPSATTPKASEKQAPSAAPELPIGSDQVSKVQAPTTATKETIQQTADRVNNVEKRETIVIQGRTAIPDLEDKPLAPGIPEPPKWLKEQEKLEVQYFYVKRDLEREAELLKIRSEIAVSEAAIRNAGKEDDDKAAGKNPGMFASPRMQNFGSQPFPQYIANLDGAAAALPPPPPPPPPAPGPPTVKRVLGDYAVLSYDGNQFTVKAGDTLPGGYRVKSVAFNSVALTTKTGDLSIAPQW